MESLQTWKNNYAEAQKLLSEFFEDQSQLEKCVEFSSLLAETFENGGTAYSCGNGGSHCDAMHFAEEFTGRFRKDRQPLPALALGAPADISCIANDFGWDQIFARPVEAFGKKGDLLLAISTSGNSENVINAVETANGKGIETVALLGKDGGKLKDLANLPIIVPSNYPDRIQEMHIKLIHTVIETVERKLFPENY